MTSAIQKALPQILATAVGAMIGAVGLYLATSAETTVAADQVTVEQARLVIEQERADMDRLDTVIRNLSGEVDRLNGQVTALRAQVRLGQMENEMLREQITDLTDELKQQRIAKEIKATERAEANRMPPRAPASIEEEPKPDPEPLPKRF